MAQSKKILHYSASWHLEEKRGVIRYKLEDGTFKKWMGENPSEFAAIVTILTGDEDPFLTDDGWITTGTDRPGP